LWGDEALACTAKEAAGRTVAAVGAGLGGAGGGSATVRCKQAGAARGACLVTQA